MADATVRLFMVLESLAREQGLICRGSSDWPPLPTLARAATSNVPVINTSNNLTRMMAMAEHSSIIIDDELTYRERATALLDEFAQQARGVLRSAGIGIDLIFVVPPSGDVILTLVTSAELHSEEWKAIRATVSSLVRRSIGLDPAQCRDVVYAMAHA